jgi:hypothetical protein
MNDSGRWETWVRTVRAYFAGTGRIDDDLKFTDSMERALNDREFRHGGLR